MQYGRGLEECDMTAERMFREYKNLKKEQGILLFQLEQFSGIEESDVIDSMMFGHADDNDRVQTSNRCWI